MFVSIPDVMLEPKLTGCNRVRPALSYFYVDVKMKKLAYKKSLVLMGKI